MPLLDHFHPPLKKERPWEGFHSAWANALARQLNHGVLPPHHVAIAQVHRGRGVEIDVAALEEEEARTSSAGTTTAVWAPPRPAVTGLIDFARLDSFEVQVFQDEDSFQLVAAIELLSPGNKDRPSHRQAFVVKCANYVQQGVGLLLADVVTVRSANLHAELLRFLHLEPDPDGQGLPELYAAAYRTRGAADQSRLEAWTEPLALGAPLPTLPLWISEHQCVPVDLEEAYSTACDWLVIP